MNHSINQNITPAGLLKFAAPSIIMMVFMSLYTIVDGIFVSRFLGSNALSSLNIVYPVINVAIAISTMLGTGGNAIVSKYLGERKEERAREALTQFVVLTLVLSIILLILSECFLTPFSIFLGASDVLLADCRLYLGPSMLFAPACMLQAVLSVFFRNRRTSGTWTASNDGGRPPEYDPGLCADCSLPDGHCRSCSGYRYRAVHSGCFRTVLFCLFQKGTSILQVYLFHEGNPGCLL